MAAVDIGEILNGRVHKEQPDLDENFIQMTWSFAVSGVQCRDIKFSWQFEVLGSQFTGSFGVKNTLPA